MTAMICPVDVNFPDSAVTLRRRDVCVPIVVIVYILDVVYRICFLGKMLCFLRSREGLIAIRVRTAACELAFCISSFLISILLGVNSRDIEIKKLSRDTL